MRDTIGLRLLDVQLHKVQGNTIPKTDLRLRLRTAEHGEATPDGGTILGHHVNCLYHLRLQGFVCSVRLQMLGESTAGGLPQLA